MADRFINWPPPPEALVLLVKAVARDMAEEHFRRDQEFLRSFSPVDPQTESDQSQASTRQE